MSRRSAINSAAIQILGVGSECIGRHLDRIGAGGAHLVALASLVGVLVGFAVLLHPYVSGRTGGAMSS